MEKVRSEAALRGIQVEVLLLEKFNPGFPQERNLLKSAIG
jgi:hypothetical protein